MDKMFSARHGARRCLSGPGALMGALICVGSIVAGAPLHAQSGPYGAVRLISEYRSVPVDAERFWAALEIRMQDGWHVYWRNPGDSGLPPVVQWNEQTPPTGDFVWPLPQEQPLGGLMNYGYEDMLVLPFEVHLPLAGNGETLRLDGLAEWLICKDVCLPESARISLNLPLDDRGRVDDAGRAAIGQALDAAPVELDGQATVQVGDGIWRLSVADRRLARARSLRFFPDGHQIDHAAEQRGFRGLSGASVDLTPQTASTPVPDSLSGVLAVQTGDGRRFGVRLGASQGDLLPQTRQTPLVAAADAGIEPSGLPIKPPSVLWLLVLAFLGGLILNLMPCVLPVLAVKAASLAGSARKDRAQVRSQAAAWTAGAVVCFVAIGIVLVLARAAGEQLGVGFQLQYPPMTAVLALLFFVIGLNLIGVFEIPGMSLGPADALADSGGRVGSFFTGFLAAFIGAPCVGPLLGAAMASVLTHSTVTVLAVFAAMGLGMALPMSAIGVSPQLARLVPRPGPWMTTFRQLLSFPMFLAMLWLLWVLAAQTGSDGVLGVLLAAVVIALALWILGVVPGRLRLVALPLIAAGLAVGVAENTRVPLTQLPETANWSPERIARLRADGQPVFVDFTARWCITCQVNKRTTLESKAVRQALATHGVTFLIADWTNRDPVIAAELASHGRIGVPLYLLYPKGGGPPEILPQILTPESVVDSIRRAVNSNRIGS